MEKINLGIVSQTPVVRLSKNPGRDIVKLSELDKQDYTYTVGGVAPMIKSQLVELIGSGFLRKATWFSLNPNAPKNIIISKGIDAVSVHLEHESSKGYTKFKEDVWNNVHNLSTSTFTIKSYLGYFKYNSELAKIMLQNYEDINLFEIHDFQQLLLGAMLGPSFPTILRWHIPFVPEILNKNIRKFVVNGLEGNDAVIVSTKRDLEGLIRAGYKGNAYQIYPHIDPSEWKKVERSRMDEFANRFGIMNGDFLVLNVARMDEIKSQDDLVKAVALLKNRKIKLMLVGGGSFTSNNLGYPKSEIWLGKLKTLVKRLGMEDRVIFAGSLNHSDLECAYTRADLFVLPSRTEGFGLVVVESWLYNTPAVVSDGAGVSELVMNGINGFTFRSGNFNELAISIFKIYKDDKMRVEMGASARGMARACYVSTTIGIIQKAYESAIENFA